MHGDLSNFIDRSSDAEILSKINTITDFLHQSISDLEHYEAIDQSKLQIAESLQKSLKINADKVTDMLTNVKLI